MEENTRGLDLVEGIKYKESSFKNHLLLIGINDYVHHTKLNYAVRDCENLCKVLMSKYRFDSEDITKLYNEEATRSNIIHALRNYGDNLGSNDTLLMYYAGHGIVDKGGNGYWIPVDAVDESSFLYNQRIVAYIKQIEALHTLLISDSCFSGSFFRATRKALIDRRLQTRKSRWAITSGRDNQEVLDDSPFSKALIKYLESNEKDTLSAPSLGEYLKNIGNNFHQIPQNGVLFGTGHDSGEYIFELRENYINSWDKAVEENIIEKYESYLTNFPDSPYREMAQKRIVQLKNDRNEWKKVISSCKTSISEFINSYSKSKYYDQAKTRLEEFEELSEHLTLEENEQKTWNDILSKDTLEGYSFYLENFPNGRFRILADKRRKELKKEKDAKEKWSSVIEAMKKQKDIEKSLWAIKAFIQDYPHIRSEQARTLIHDISFFKKATELNSKEMLEEYIDRYPNAFYKNRAKKQLKNLEVNEEIRWLLDSRSIPSLKKYIETKTDMLSVDEFEAANSLIEEDKRLFDQAKSLNTKEAYEEYLEAMPDGVYTDEVRLKIDDIDEQHYMMAIEENTIESYERYIANFKEGIYISEAKNKLSKLNSLEALEQNNSAGNIIQPKEEYKELEVKAEELSRESETFQDDEIQLAKIEPLLSESSEIKSDFKSDKE